MKSPAQGLLVREIKFPTAADFEILSRLAIEASPPDDPSPLALGAVSLRADSLAHSDATLPQRCFRSWWIVEETGGTASGEPIGFAFVRQFPQIFDPGKYHVGFSVRPSARGRGVGQALFHAVSATLERLEPTSLWIFLRESDEVAMSWASRRGFSRDLRTWESALPPASADLSRIVAQEAALKAQGIEIDTLARLKRAEPFQWKQKMYELDCEVTRDAPLSSGFTPPGLQCFIDQRVLNPAVVEDGFHIARLGDQYIGYSCLFRTPDERIFHTGMTGVSRVHRRKGVATVMKLKGIAFAREHGATSLLTSNEASNHGMLALNLKLGFRIRTGWIEMRKIVMPGAWQAQ